MNKKIIMLSLGLSVSANAFGAPHLDQSISDGWTHVPGNLEKTYPDLSQGYYPTQLEPMVGISTPKISAEMQFNFADLAYKAEKDPVEYTALTTKYAADGWSFQRLMGTTGSADKQVESVMGVIATRGKQIVISTRGTIGLDDLKTDFRSDRNMLARIWDGLLGNPNSDDIEALIAAQFGFYGEGADYKAHNGFLQTHLSMYKDIRQAILDLAEAQGCALSEIDTYFNGHSMGAALTHLHMVHALNDSTLGFGKKTVETSFTTEGDLDMSGFFGLARKENVENTNVRALAIDGPGVFAAGTTDQINNKIGKDNLTNIENAGDPIPHVPEFMGYGKAGTTIEVDAGCTPGLEAHKLGNIKKAAVPALDNVGNAPEKTVARHITDGIAAIVTAPITALSYIANAASSAWNYVKSYW